ncbi:unnamed protein product [Acanthoscelides obtectus]|uniref:Uncharacterized protein n=1 Tax=Acanthoscelides obtectus TaxID=200917 RepID=A0A9P0LX40_ACAOB|nr:unnamed protein product [Acanthoscelides obtectus]CAK1619951.1 hypothetical protein AOBTE_LOCUS100 [Acanthoscelides obtectus]
MLFASAYLNTEETHTRAADLNACRIASVLEIGHAFVTNAKIRAQEPAVSTLNVLQETMCLRTTERPM